MKRHPLFDRLRGITREIVATYDASQEIASHIDPERRLPSRTVVVRILENLFAVLYPGFYGVQHLTHGNVEYHVGALLDDIAADLYEQVVLAYELMEPGEELPVEGPVSGWEEERIPRLAERAVGLFLGRIPELRRMLVLDVQATMDGDPAARSFAEVIFAYPGFEAVTIQRIAHELWELGVPLLPRIMTEHAHSKTGIDLHPGARIGESFFIDHGTGVVIGETAVIGKRVKIYQGVTLGALSAPKDPAGGPPRGAKRHPTLGDDVVVYSGATILGGDTVIGDGAVVGSNTWVIESVPPGEKVLFTRTSREKQEEILARAYGLSRKLR
ncbi:MAG TPA: serine O-acetyltransferase EpsC [Solirubrobacterales bacterium]|nr:serine O-acetyltransferase EpsC [Solirubrobacterales bacterium]